MRLRHQIILRRISLLRLCTANCFQAFGSPHHFSEFRFHLIARPGVPLAGQGDDALGWVLGGAGGSLNVRRLNEVDDPPTRAIACPTSRFNMSVAVKTSEFLCRRLGVFDSEPEHNEAADVAKDRLPDRWR